MAKNNSDTDCESATHRNVGDDTIQSHILYCGGDKGSTEISTAAESCPPIIALMENASFVCKEQLGAALKRGLLTFQG